MPITRLAGPSRFSSARDVVRPHVEHRAAAGLEEERRVRVPVLVAAADHERGEADRLADQAVVDDLARRLQARAEEGIRRAADAEVSRLTVGDEFAAPD
ncbi:MAG: hypothetical protein QM754_16680 [Tepidisphaeraceae bacterium]